MPTPLFKAGRGTAVGERFRVLRSRIETVGFGTFMVTSALDQEGKTLCATNLAFALSTSLGAGVILVDADLRRPNVGSWFGIRGGNGLADCLLGDARWSECLRATEHQHLRLLPAGRESGLSTELLASDRMATLLTEIKAANPRHYVIVDAPPLLLTADPLVLARHVDHVLLVVRAGITPRAAVQKAIEMLGSERFLGIVLNGTEGNLSDYYQYRYGRYGYDRPTAPD
ncbi:polysaccharide biosynthesis tyrosine autokinase [Candidatus Binatia bacterium]|nr:polysaccharide biosynthesis tyrosine autokinase [Candidatus Binatia bacterium]